MGDLSLPSADLQLRHLQGNEAKMNRLGKLTSFYLEPL